MTMTALRNGRAVAHALFLAAVTLAATAPGAASARDAPVSADADTPSADESTIIVTGTSAKGLSERDSPVPVDVVSGEDLSRTGDVDLRTAISRLVPSLAFQVAPYISARFKENMTLHGLSTNHLLVLVNGLRRHGSSNITTQVGPQQSATGVDIGLIPASAIQRVEVLRDGDSAHYGADALAGVVNVILKDAADGGSLQATLGQFYAGDGLSRNVSVNAGMALGQNGFLNISAEYSGTDMTRRVYLQTNTRQRSPNQPSMGKQTLFYNAGYDLDGNATLYSQGSYGHRRGNIVLNRRSPASLPAVYPDGYEPRQTVKEHDYSGAAGIRFRDLAGWSADLSTSYGGNENRFGLRNSANTSLHAATGATPTHFYVYGTRSAQWSTRLSLARPIDTGFLAMPLTLSLGGEYRREYFTLSAGQPESYYGSGTQGVVGLSPVNATSASRDIFGAFGDISADITSRWQLSLSGRMEHYSDSGDTTVGRVTTRYDMSDAIAVRGTIGTGFAAPTLAQQHFSNVTNGVGTVLGFLAPDSAAVRSLGGQSLRPERSTNYNLGLVLRPASGLDVTIDGYWIDVRGRIIPGGTASGQQAVDVLAIMGLQILPGTPVNAVRTSYLVNGADTRTRGIDVSARYTHGLGSFGRLDWTLNANINRTTLTRLANGSNGAPLLNLQQRNWLTTTTPRFKAIVGADWTLGAFSATIRENIFGPTVDQASYYAGPNANSITVFHRFRQGYKYTTDISISYDFGEATRITAGANNLFGVYPDVMPFENRLQGMPYNVNASQVGIFGGYYYASIRHRF